MMSEETILTRQFRQRFTRIVAAFLSFALASSSVVPAGATNVWSDRRRSTPPQFASLAPGATLPALPPIAAIRISDAQPRLLALRDSENISSVIPGNLGSVRRVLVPADGTPRATVLLIQDIHRNPEAQANIAEAVSLFTSGRSATVVGLEGAWGPVDLSSFEKFPDPAAMRSAAESMLRQNFLTGPVLAALRSPGFSVVGVDDEKLHRANADAVRAAAARGPTETQALASARATLAAETASLPAGLRALLQAADDYHADRLALSAFVRALSKTRARPTPEITRFLAASDIERSLNFAEVERQRAALLSDLIPRLNDTEVRALLAETAAYRAGGLAHAAFYDHLWSLASAKGLRLASYGAMQSYVHYTESADRIDPDRLMSEASAFETAAFAAAATTPAERALVARAGALRERAKLVQLALTPSDWNAHVAGRDGDPYEDFYRRAIERDEAMAGNLVREIDQRHARAAALIVGGFHAAGVARRLVDRGFTVVVFSPTVTKVDLAGGTAYLDVFTREKTPLDRLFEGPKLFLAEEVMTPPARARLGLTSAAIAFKRASAAAGDLVSFLQSGLHWTGVRISNVLASTVRIEGTSPTAGAVALEVNLAGTEPDLRAVPVGVWDVWRPLWRTVRDKVRLRGDQPQVLTLFLAGIGSAEELIARPLLGLLVVPGLAGMGLAPVAAWAIVIVGYAFFTAFVLHWYGIFAWADGTDQVTRKAHVEIFSLAIGIGIVQATLSVAPAWITLPVLAALHATHTLVRFRGVARAVAVPAGKPIKDVDEARSILQTNLTKEPQELKRVLEAIEWLGRHPSSKGLDGLIRMANYFWVGKLPILGVRMRQTIRQIRHTLEPDSGPSRRVHLLAKLEQDLLSETLTLREKGDVIQQILANPGSQDVTILSDALYLFHQRNPQLAVMLIDAIAQVRQTGVLTQQSSPHETMRSRVFRVLDDMKLDRSLFKLAYRDNGRTLEVRWRFPAGQSFVQAQTLLHELRKAYNSANEALDPGMELVDAPGAFPQGNQGSILLKFKPDMANLSDFQRSFGVDEIIRGRDGHIRRRLPIEMTDLIEELGGYFLEGLDSTDPQRAAIINEIFGDGKKPGISTAVRDLQKLGGEEIVPVESYNTIDPETRETRSSRRVAIGPMLRMGEAIPYVTHYIPEFDVDSWLMFGRAAAVYFTGASLKGFLRNHVEQRDRMVIVSRDTISHKLWFDLHEELRRLLARLDIGEPAVPNFTGVRLATAQWMRTRYYLSPEIKVGGVTGVMRYREATAHYDDEGFLVESLPIYDHRGPGAQRIGDVQRRRNLSTDDAPIYMGFRLSPAQDAPWQPVVNSGDVVVTNDNPNDGLWAHVVRMVSEQVSATGALSLPPLNNTSPFAPLNVVLIDEIGWGTFPTLTAFALEQLNRQDEEDMPPSPELQALRLQDPLTLTPADVDRWNRLEKEYRRSRTAANRRPVEAQIFIGAPPLYMAAALQYLNPFSYPSVDQLAMAADYGMSYGGAGLIMQAGTSVVDQGVGHGYFVDLDGMVGNQFRGTYIAGETHTDLGRPVLGQRIPLGLESEPVQIGSYLKDLYIYNGVIKYYENEYERLAVPPLLAAIKDGNATVRARALFALRSFDFPDAVRGIVNAAQERPALVEEARDTAEQVTTRLLANAIAFDDANGPRVLNIELLIARVPLLSDLASDTDPFPGLRTLAKSALAALNDAQTNSSMLGIPVDRYLALSADQKRAMRAQGVYAVPIVSSEADGQNAELTQAARPLGIFKMGMVTPTWNPPTPQQTAEILRPQPLDGGLIPAITRIAIAPFVALFTRVFGLSPATSVGLYRLFGAIGTEEALFTGAPVALIAGVSIFFGLPATSIALAALAVLAPLRIAFVLAHPDGRRAGPAIIAAIALIGLVTAPFLGAGTLTTLLVATLPGVAGHLGLNIITDLFRSAEERAAERVALALTLGERGRPKDAAAAINDLLAGADARVSVDSLTGLSAAERLAASTKNSDVWNGPAFAQALARQFRAINGRPLSPADAVKLLQSVARGDFAGVRASTLGDALDRAAAEDASAPGKRFVHVILDDAEAANAAALIRVALSKRASPNETILISATSERAAQAARAAAPASGVDVRLVESAVAGNRRSIRVAELPGEWNGASVRALLVSDGIDLNLDSLPDSSPYRSIAIILINIALQAVRLPALGELERTARLISSQA